MTLEPDCRKCHETRTGRDCSYCGKTHKKGVTDVAKLVKTRDSRGCPMDIAREGGKSQRCGLAIACDTCGLCERHSLAHNEGRSFGGMSASIDVREMPANLSIAEAIANSMEKHA